MIRRKFLSMILMTIVLLMSVMPTFAQSSSNSTARAELITGCEQAVKEVVTSRAYITELEASYKKALEQIAAQDKAGTLSADELAAKRAEADELRLSISALTAANLDRVKQIGKMQAKINKLQGQVSFWRKVAGVTSLLAVAAAAVVLLH